MSKVGFSSSGGLLGTLASSSSPSRSQPLVRRDIPPQDRVRRNLFGPVDHEELNCEMKARLHDMFEQDQRRWNFNFSTGVPLLGEYEWEETPGETSPAFYHECVRAAKKTPLDVNKIPTPTLQTDDCVEDENMNLGDRHVYTQQSAQDKRSANRSSSSRKMPCKIARRKRPSPLTTTRITDFYVKRRSNDGVKRSENNNRKSFSSVPEEQTPRKQIR